MFTKISPTSSDILHDSRPVALTPVVMKCFEKLVLRHIRDYPPATLESHQFAHRASRSTEDTIAKREVGLDLLLLTKSI